MAVLLRVIHWGPLIALFIVGSVTITSTYAALQLWSLPQVRFFRLPNFMFMYLWLIPILTNFFHAMNSGPGYVPLGWKPVNPEDEKNLQHCRVCQGFKPPRSHHCRQCGRCIKKMDHHCPWINHCVGHSNHASFMKFLFFVPLGCLHGVVLNINFLYRFINYDFLYIRPYLKINTFWLIYLVSTVGLAIGAIIGVMILFIVQLKSVLNNQTQIEDWIVNKAERRRQEKDTSFVFPYDLGTWNNFKQVINWSGRPKGDGVEWPIKPGCEKYSLTLEQLEQKRLKKAMALSCEVKCDYSGSMCPLSFGLMTVLCAPQCSEGNIRVCKGEVFTVTRRQAYWVYGDKKLEKVEVEGGVRVRGWFPRRCVDTPTDRRHEKKQD